MVKRYRLRFRSFTLLLVLAALVGGCTARAPGRCDGLAAAHVVEIRRDSFGVPHIYGATDADVAFGLAYAHAEDDFETLQETMLAARGKLASLQGSKAAMSDYLVALLDVHKDVEARYESDLSPEVRAVVEAYATGINAYAAQHPDEIRVDFEPVRGKDIVAGFVLTSPMFFGLDRELRRLFAGELGDTPPRGAGSNAFAVSPSRSTDGYTRLIANSHQPYSGPVAWYEARLHSDEGWNVEGSLFPGSPFVLIGHNRHLAWTNTVNRPDLVDIYRLEIDPNDEYRYRLDGEWREFERGEARIRVKLWGPFYWTVSRETLRSAHGPVLRTEHGTYAFRYAGIGDIRQVEQYFRIDKAHNFDDFMEAMRLQAIPATNFIYADDTGRIAYFYNARFPERQPGVAWREVLPGDRSDLIWDRYVTFDRIPQLVDPPSGFVFNSNNKPFVATGTGDNLRPEDFPEEWGIETFMTNRAYRSQELLDTDVPISREDLLRFKFDLEYSRRSPLAAAVEEVLAADSSGDELLAEAQAVLRRWDFRTNRDNRTAALGMALAVAQLKARLRGAPLPEPVPVVRDAAAHLRDHFGRLDVTVAEFQRLVRGSVDVPLDGSADVLRAVSGDYDDDGRIVADKGDTFILLVEWDAEGRLRSESIHQFGSATSRPESPHYDDQAPLFAEMQFKPVHFEEEDLATHTSARYRPCETWTAGR